jgi:hypothetical protein
MPARRWLPHPPPPPRPRRCPSGLPEFATRDLALDAALGVITGISRTPTACNDHWHLDPPVEPRPAPSGAGHDTPRRNP